MLNIKLHSSQKSHWIWMMKLCLPNLHSWQSSQTFVSLLSWFFPQGTFFPADCPAKNSIDLQPLCVVFCRMKISKLMNTDEYEKFKFYVSQLSVKGKFCSPFYLEDQYWAFRDYFTYVQRGFWRCSKSYLHLKRLK